MSEAQQAAAVDPEPVQRIGIVVVHGVMPHPRYEIQDQCASELAKALNLDGHWKDPEHPWVSSIYEPLEGSVAKTLVPRPTTSRVRRDGDDPIAPQDTFFDVTEAYWSPLDKGKATFTRVVGWLLQTVFVPLNTTATYVSQTGKTLFDVTLVSCGILAGIGFVVAALLCAAVSLARLSGKDIPDTANALIGGKFIGLLPFSSLAIVAIGIAGSYLIAQAIKGAAGLAGQQDARNLVPAQTRSRIILIVVVAIVGAALLAIVWGDLGVWALLLAVTGPLFEGGRTIAESFLVNFFGDVQIYTTRNENADYFAMREAILDRVASTIEDVARWTDANGKPYDRVFVLAHSLGSTIALDALLQYKRAVQQIPVKDRAEALAAFRRIRGFVTFGSPLEKTKYFFDVNNPSPSLALEQWRSDSYGPLFTCDIAELVKPNHMAQAIFWANYWYFADPVSNEMWSYRSFVPAGANVAIGHRLRRMMSTSRQAAGDGAVVGRLVCWNERGSKGLGLPDVIPHGEYLKDPWFWKTEREAERAITRMGPSARRNAAGNERRGHLGVLDVVARTKHSIERTAFVKCKAEVDPHTGATYERLSMSEAGKLHDFRPPDTST